MLDAVELGMATKIKSRSARPTFVVGRRTFAKISAIEGITLSAQAENDFREFDRRGLSAAERRKALRRKYGRKVQIGSA